MDAAEWKRWIVNIETLFEELLSLTDSLRDKEAARDLQQNTVDDGTKAEGQVAKCNSDTDGAKHDGNRVSPVKAVTYDRLMNLDRELKANKDREEASHSNIDVFKAIELSALANGFAIPKKTGIEQDATSDGGSSSSAGTHEETQPEISSTLGVGDIPFLEEQLHSFRRQTIWVSTTKQ